MGIDLLVVTLPRVLVYTAVMLDEAVPNRLYAFIHETGPRLTYGLYRIKWFRGVSVSLALVGIPFATEGPERGVVETTT